MCKATCFSKRQPLLIGADLGWLGSAHSLPVPMTAAVEVSWGNDFQLCS